MVKYYNNSLEQRLDDQKRLSLQNLKKLTLQKIRRKKSIIQNHHHTTKFSNLQKSSQNQLNRHKILPKSILQPIIQDDQYECPICLQILIEPTILQCGHVYCYKCIQQLMIYRSLCSICRKQQKNSQFKQCILIKNIIEKIIIKNSDKYISYYCRLVDYNKWKTLRKVNLQSIHIASFIDFRDKELKWRKAEITSINRITDKNDMETNEDNGIYLIKVKYSKQGEEIYEQFHSNSNRYAKHTYYTRMKYREAECETHEPSTFLAEQEPEHIHLNNDESESFQENDQNQIFLSRNTITRNQQDQQYDYQSEIIKDFFFSNEHLNSGYPECLDESDGELERIRKQKYQWDMVELEELVL